MVSKMQFPIEYYAESQYKSWKKMPYGIKQQAEVVDYIERLIESSTSLNLPIVMSDIYINAKNRCNVSTSTARRWWEWFQQHGELKAESKRHMKAVQRKYNWLPRNAIISQAELKVLEDVLNENPAAYLDEVAVSLGRRTGKYFRVSTISRYTRKYLGYTLQTLNEVAKQQCDKERENFKLALDILLDNQPELLVMVDETHKDQNMSRRRRGWGKRNSGGVTINSWYKRSNQGIN